MQRPDDIVVVPRKPCKQMKFRRHNPAIISHNLHENYRFVNFPAPLLTSGSHSHK